MSRPRVYGERVQTAVRIERGLYERLQAESESREVSVNLLVNNAIRRWLLEVCGTMERPQ